MLIPSPLIKFLIVLTAEGITFIAIGKREIINAANFGSILIPFSFLITSLTIFGIYLSFNSLLCAIICSFDCLFAKTTDAVVPGADDNVQIPITIVLIKGIIDIKLPLRSIVFVNHQQNL